MKKEIELNNLSSLNDEINFAKYIQTNTETNFSRIKEENTQLKKFNRVMHSGFGMFAACLAQMAGSVAYTRITNQQVSEENFLDSPASYIFFSAMGSFITGNLLMIAANQFIKIDTEENNQKLIEQFLSQQEIIKHVLGDFKNISNKEVSLLVDGLIHKLNELTELAKTIKEKDIKHSSISKEMALATEIIEGFNQLVAITERYENRHVEVALEEQQQTGFSTSIKSLVHNGYNRMSSMFKSCVPQEKLAQDSTETLSLLTNETETESHSFV